MGDKMRSEVLKLLYSTYFNSVNPDEILSTIHHEWKKYDYMFAQCLSPLKSCKILDIGCGYGKLLAYLKNKGYKDILGVDISESALPLASKLGVSNYIIIKDIREFLLSCEDDCFDLVFAIDVLEHFPLNDIFTISENVYRILKKGGRFIIQMPNGESPFVGGIFYGDLTHITLLNQYSIQQLLNACCFKQISSFPTYPLPSSLRFYLHKIVTVFLRRIFPGKILSSNFLTVAQK